MIHLVMVSENIFCTITQNKKKNIEQTKNYSLFLLFYMSTLLFISGYGFKTFVIYYIYFFSACRLPLRN